MTTRLLVLLFLALPMLAAGQADSIDPVVRELLAVQDPVTASVWLQRHPEEKLQLFAVKLAKPAVAGWCSRTEKQFQSGTITWTRDSYFYLPATLALPANDHLQPELARECRLGAVWISGAGTSADVDAEIDRLNSDFSSRFGEPGHRLNVDESFFGSAFWKPLSLWREKSPQANYLIAKNRDQHPLALAWLAASQLATPFADYDPVSQAAAPIVVAQKFVPQAGLPAELTQRMQALLQTELSLIKGNGQQKLDDTQFVNTIADWVKAAAGLDASHRAAALLVADRALDAGCGYSNLEVRGSEMGTNIPTAESNRKKLETLGAMFHYAELDGGYLYQHDWLKQAEAMNANQQVEDAIFVDLLDRGFDTSGTCAVSEQFRRVIREGKQYLTAHPQTAAAPEILMAIADANRDIVALAGGAAPGYSNSRTYAAEKETARVSAIDYYRQAIAATTDEALKQKATRSAWELIAGIEPAKTRFFCVYD